jgi:hypothetical protein
MTRAREIASSDLEQLDKLFAHTSGEAWEPKGGRDLPWIVRMVDSGYLRHCVMRCGFEAMDTGIKWTDAGRRVMERRAGARDILLQEKGQ